MSLAPMPSPELDAPTAAYLARCLHLTGAAAADFWRRLLPFERAAFREAGARAEQP